MTGSGFKFQTRPKITLSGDWAAAKGLHGFALNELAKLKQLMSFRDLKQDVRLTRLVDGSRILCRSVFGQDFVDIFVPLAEKAGAMKALVWTGSSYKGAYYTDPGTGVTRWVDRMFFVNYWNGYQEYDRSFNHFYTLSAQYLGAEIDDGEALPDLEDVFLLYIPNLYRELTIAEKKNLQNFTARGGKLILAGDWLQITGGTNRFYTLGSGSSFHSYTNNALSAVGSPLSIRPELAAQGWNERPADLIYWSSNAGFSPGWGGVGACPPPFMTTGQYYSYAAAMFNPKDVSGSVGGLKIGSYYPWMIWFAGFPTPVFVSNPNESYSLTSTSYSSIFPYPRGNYIAGNNAIVERVADKIPGRWWHYCRDFWEIESNSNFKPLTESIWVCHVPTNTMLLGFTTWSEHRDYYIDRSRFTQRQYSGPDSYFAGYPPAVNGWHESIHNYVRRHDIHYVWKMIANEPWNPVEINFDPVVYYGWWDFWDGGNASRLQSFPEMPLIPGAIGGGGIVPPIQE